MQTALARTVIQCLLVCLTTGIGTGFAQRNSLTIYLDTSRKQLTFAGNQIQQAARQQGYNVRMAVAGSGSVDDKKGVVIKLISDSAAVWDVCRDAKLKQPQSLGWQCYAIRIGQTNGQKTIYVLAGEPTGTMYGGLDVAEAIRQLESLARPAGRFVHGAGPDTGRHRSVCTPGPLLRSQAQSGL